MTSTVTVDSRKLRDHLTLVPEPKSLLLIEDDLSLVDFMDVVIDEMRPGLDWDYVTSGEAALERIHWRGRSQRGNPYSLVIADIFLEGEMTGFDVWLDAQQFYPEMPFVMMSCLTFDRYFSIFRGVNKYPVYLPKPLTVSRCQSVLMDYV